MITKDDIKAAGGIVHGDGNVFFTNLDQLNKMVQSKLKEVVKEQEVTSEMHPDIKQWCEGWNEAVDYVHTDIWEIK